jgi:hypothetical protein
VAQPINAAAASITSINSRNENRQIDRGFAFGASISQIVCRQDDAV